MFNSVLSKETKNDPVFLDEFGVFIPKLAVHALSDINKHLKDLKLSGEELNKTFHKSWKKVKESSRLELAIHQIIHYMSTYGDAFDGYVYIPSEELDLTTIEPKFKVAVINTLSKDELIKKSLSLLTSGIALKEETINAVFEILDLLKYQFTGEENIRNKEAQIILAERFGILPNSSEEFVRYLVYVMTNETLLVKNKNTILLIIASNKDVSKLIKSFGVERLAESFNRFKPLFLAIKKANKNNTSVINKVSKLSKTLHKPMVQNPLNTVTSVKLNNQQNHWLENATVYSLFKALSVCFSRKNGQNKFVYRIRTGKSWVNEGTPNISICEHNYNFILKHLKKRLENKNGQNVFIPENVQYSLPTSEKMYVGNIPTGTKFMAKKLAAGIYWENSWGANDLDLSALSINGKVGWDSSYSDDDVTYSGDLTDARKGAVEYLLVDKKETIEPLLVMNNVYSGEADSGYKIVVGEGDDIDRKYMMNPNNVILDVKTNSVQKSTVVGLMMTEDDGLHSFTILNFGAGNAHVAGNNEVSTMAKDALYQQWKETVSFEDILKEIGFNVFKNKDSDIDIHFDFAIDNLTKTSFIDIFE